MFLYHVCLGAPPDVQTFISSLKAIAASMGESLATATNVDVIAACADLMPNATASFNEWWKVVAQDSNAPSSVSRAYVLLGQMVGIPATVVHGVYCLSCAHQPLTHAVMYLVLRAWLLRPTCAG